ncbi:MAG: hypothetical protein F4056_07005 [Chloroflexi bacterium]|nr:hypothetical protein [Gammaproteobacteria bacterium]MYH47326.1 hypothetical protein [Gammaproteobacteria bacterium]MYI83035.1 hypothetical protein [Chloroflexota bacterium]MYL12944.1 hypothetical protein [Gammaproteobacteria bacterium]
MLTLVLLGFAVSAFGQGRDFRIENEAIYGDCFLQDHVDIFSDTRSRALVCQKSGLTFALFTSGEYDCKVEIWAETDRVVDGVYQGVDDFTGQPWWSINISFRVNQGQAFHNPLFKMINNGSDGEAGAIAEDCLNFRQLLMRLPTENTFVDSDYNNNQPVSIALRLGNVAGVMNVTGVQTAVRIYRSRIARLNVFSGQGTLLPG